MAEKKKSKSTLKKSSTKTKEPVNKRISEAKRKVNALASISSMEDQYPGITEQYLSFENAKLPSCSHCGSNDTASVQVGIVGRTIYLNGASRKFKLVPNMSDKRGRYYCNNCEKFFD